MSVLESSADRSQKAYSGIDQLHIELLAERLIRKQLLLQHVATNHPVLVTEERLVQEADALLREEIQTLHMSGESVQLVEMTTIVRVRNAIRLMIGFHDVDEDTAESVVYGAGKEAYVLIAKSKPAKCHTWSHALL
jgi:hypothetical protein